MALSCPLSLPTIQDVTMKRVGSFFVTSVTNLPDSVISSPKTKAMWSWSEDSANVSQGRTNVNIQSTPVEWAVRKVGGGGSPAMQGLYIYMVSVFHKKYMVVNADFCLTVHL